MKTKHLIIISIIILGIGIILIVPATPSSNADSTMPSAKSNPDAAFTAATFADKYKDMSFTGKKISVMIKVAGESENSDPSKRAKEIRYLQSYVLKFLSFSNAVNVVSKQQKNEITAQIDTAWIPILEQRSDVISVTVLEIQKDGKTYLDNLPPKKQQSQNRSISEIHCANDLVLIQKYDNSPACVNSESVMKLIERKWAKPTPSLFRDESKLGFNIDLKDPLTSENIDERLEITKGFFDTHTFDQTIILQTDIDYISKHVVVTISSDEFSEEMTAEYYEEKLEEWIPFETRILVARGFATPENVEP